MKLWLLVLLLFSLSAAHAQVLKWPDTKAKLDDYQRNGYQNFTIQGTQ